MKPILLGLFALLLLLKPALAADITGVVYDLNLDEVKTAVVSTSDGQRMVARTDGSYTFNVPGGTYTISANATIDGVRYTAEENITVGESGDYVLDLILVPTLSGDTNLTIGDPAPNVGLAPRQGTGTGWWVLGAVLLVAAGVGGYWWQSRRKDDPPLTEDEFRSEVIDVLKKSHGRATQKEIRRAVRFSEAKVSLVLSELEDEGLVKKIKRGRGNIIVLK